MSDQPKLRAVLHMDEDGNHHYYADADVELYVVCDFAPSDRVYKAIAGPIPDGFLDDDPVKESVANVRAHRAAAAILGVLPLTVVDGDGEAS